MFLDFTLDFCTFSKNEGIKGESFPLHSFVHIFAKESPGRKLTTCAASTNFFPTERFSLTRRTKRNLSHSFSTYSRRRI